MTAQAHDEQRARVKASLMADDGIETHRNVYPLRRDYWVRVVLPDLEEWRRWFAFADPDKTGEGAGTGYPDGTHRVSVFFAHTTAVRSLELAAELCAGRCISYVSLEATPVMVAAWRAQS